MRYMTWKGKRVPANRLLEHTGDQETTLMPEEEFTGAMFLMDLIQNEYNDFRLTEYITEERFQTSIDVLFWQYSKGVEEMARVMETNGCFTTGMSREDPLYDTY